MLTKLKDNLFLKYGKNQHNGGAEKYSNIVEKEVPDRRRRVVYQLWKLR